MAILDKIVVSNTVPSQANVLWIKPIGNGASMYAHIKGRWVALILMDDKGTFRPDDDTIEDISNIKELIKSEVQKGISEGIEEAVASQIESQMQAYDVSVGDTHNTESSDTGDYPDVTIY